MSGVLIKGAIDKLDLEGAIGWLYSPSFEEGPIVRAFLHHEMIGETKANDYRRDLQDVGFGDGHCGFTLKFNREIDSASLPFVTIKPHGVELALSAPSSNGYLDIVKTALGNYPGAGRSRSVLGGLWTDRTDAPQLLAGKVRTGSLPDELQPKLQELILDGYITLYNELAPAGLSSKELSSLKTASAACDDDITPRLKTALNIVSNLLFRDNLIRLMRAIFDDQPVAYRLDSVSSDEVFVQASSFEASPSPTECLVLYIGNPGGTTRIDIVRNSHELSEFDPQGHSRWTPVGAPYLSHFASEAGLSIETIELDGLDMAIVGPGLAHRVHTTEGAPLFRALLFPRRVTPTRFLTGDANWTEIGHTSGGRIRV